MEGLFSIFTDRHFEINYKAKAEIEVLSSIPGWASTTMFFY